MKSIYVGNLPLDATDDAIRTLFSPYGMVDSVLLIFDHPEGDMRAHAFVEMDDAEAAQAIEALNGRRFGEQALEVSEVRSQPAVPRRPH